MDTRQQFLKDILSTALYGIGYWASVERFGNDNNEYVYDMDDPTIRWLFNARLVEKGIAKVLSPGFLIADEVLKSILWGNHMNDAGEIDIIGADVIIQAATLGEIVYG
jgi:hypothetical protein